MPVDWNAVPDPIPLGRELHDLMTELFPIPRSLTGDGVRTTLARLARDLPLDVVELPTGTRVFDWTLPREWNVREAWVEAPDGTRVIDAGDSSLHLLGYSTAIDETVDLGTLREHLHTDPRDPDVIPYRTSYWAEQWGFCTTQRLADSLPAGDYRVRIDASLEDGSVTYGEVALDGIEDAVFLLSTTICHPALANDNLSGIVVLAGLGRILRDQPLRHSFRLLWSPGTIGPLCWLHSNPHVIPRIHHGFAVSCVGDPGPLTYKRSRRGAAEVDEAAAVVLRSRPGARVRDWSPYGGDERQFCSPGFDLPFGALSRTPADEFPQYHSSADDLDLVRPDALGDSVHAALAIVDAIERNAAYVNASPYGEPQLGRRGLYRSVGGGSSKEAALLWVLSLSDGHATLLDIAARSGLPFATIRHAADALLTVELLRSADVPLRPIPRSPAARDRAR
jgi:aminopeptidase-like protein